jgi:hypothetical protein
VGVRQLDGTDLADPDVPVVIEVAPQDEPSATQQVEAGFSWIVPDAIGLYRAEVDFDRPGIWTATVIPDGDDPLDRTPFMVLEETVAPAVGALAPAAPTPTLDDAPLEELTTDPEPDVRFYELSLEEALANGKPTVLVFATPAFCQTAACGPLLDNVKAAAPGYPNVNFLHVEVYTGLQDPDFQPDVAHLAPAVGPDWWNLPSEPWGFVIDPDGIVVARFEGTLDATELVPYIGSPTE